jgi:hypothetical protein
MPLLSTHIKALTAQIERLDNRVLDLQAQLDSLAEEWRVEFEVETEESESEEEESDDETQSVQSAPPAYKRQRTE